jgi:hypothetical protein
MVFISDSGQSSGQSKDVAAEPEETMAKQFECLAPAHAAFIAAQHIFFTASAAATGRINISPRSTGAFRVLDATAVAYLDETGSGNETAAHLRLLPRLTIMFCGFGNIPKIMRLYGTGQCLRRGTPEYASLLEAAFANHEPPGARQIIRLNIEMVQTSCGYGVPLFDYKEERPTLRRWAENKGEDGVAAYWREKNIRSIDGFETGVASGPPANAGDFDADLLTSPQPISPVAGSARVAVAAGPGASDEPDPPDPAMAVR